MRAKAECWDGGIYSYVVTVDGKPIGAEIWKVDAQRIANWLNDGGLRELEKFLKEKGA